MRTISSAYASAPTKLEPMKQKTPDLGRISNKSSIYTQKRTGLKTPAGLSPLTARK